MSIKSRAILWAIEAFTDEKYWFRRKLIIPAIRVKLDAWFKEAEKMDSNEAGKSKWKSKSFLVAVITVVLGAIGPISAAMGTPIVVPTWVYEVLAGLGLYALRDGIGKPLKSLILAAILGSLCAVSSVQASPVSSLYRDIRENTRFTAFESVTPAYFHSWDRAEDGGGAVTSVLTYRFLSGDAGWKNALSGDKTGTAVLGGNIHLDQLFRQFLPDVADYFKYLVIPDNSKRLWVRASVGIWGGYDTATRSWDYGYLVGPEVKW